MLLAGGEHNYTPAAFAERGRHGSLDLWQPAVIWAGGITGTLRILAGAPERRADRPAPRRRAVGPPT